MKRILLALFFIGAAFGGRSQVVLNEFYIDASNANRKQFFELYNTGNTTIDLSCYSLVSLTFNNQGVVSSIRVLDLPDGATIAPKQFYTGGNGTSTLINGVNRSFSYNWNTTSGGASFKTYPVTNGVTIGTGTTTTGDFFVTSNGNTKNAVFLFDGSQKAANSDVAYINGFVAYGSNATSTIPSTPFNFQNLGSLLNPTAACSVSQINWKNVTTSEYNGSASGSGHGYYRSANGICGTWFKQPDRDLFTPGYTNGFSVTNQYASGDITTSQLLICGTRVDWKILQIIDPKAAPLTVELYHDKGVIGSFDQADELQTGAPNEPVTVTLDEATGEFSPSAGTFTIPANQRILVVFRTALGCISTVLEPTVAAGTLSTNQVNVCNRQLAFSIPGGDQTALAYAFPVTVSFLNNGIQIGNSITVESPSSSLYYSDILETAFDPTQIAIQYIPSNCLAPSTVTDASSAAFRQATGALSTSETNVCGKRIDFKVIGATGDAADNEAYTLPVTVELYNEGQTELLATTGENPITAFSSTQVHSLPVPEAYYNSNLVLVYKTAFACFGKTVDNVLTSMATGTAGGIVECEVDANNNRKANYFLVDADPVAFPIEIKIYEDIAKNRDLATSTYLNSQTVLEPKAPQEESYPTYTQLLSKPNSFIIVTASSPGCLDVVESIINSCTVLPVHFTNFTATRKDGNVQLKWETATEQNNKGFHVQRNIDGEWKTVAFVFAATETGNSTTVNGYAFLDNNPAKGLTQYRLIQEDHDGRVAYSRIVPVQGLQGSSRLLVYPNPSTNGSVTVLFDNASSLRDVLVSDLAGRVVKQYRSVANGSLNVGYLLKGFYTIKVINRTTGATQVEKVIIK
jgi:hypothetical protein